MVTLAVSLYKENERLEQEKEKARKEELAQTSKELITQLV